MAPFSALAQGAYWVQIEAHATLRTAEEFATRYQERLGQVAGFRIAGGWYALAVGPYATSEEADAERAALLARGEIREDSYVTDSAIYGQQFWPAGGQALSAPAAEPAAGAEVEPAATDAAEPDAAGEATQAAVEAVAEEAPAAEPEPEVVAPAAPALADYPEESLADARRLEYDLTRDDRMAIQVALQWFGHYRSLIDADFGPGTRAAIRAWQEAQGVEPTGYLTTRQRMTLLTGYESAVARYAFGPFRDEEAGIEVTLPLGMIAFDHHEAPFAHFNEINDSGMRLLLLSQEGSQSTFFGLYEILQTLEVIPLEGARERGRDSFTITGRSAGARAHAEARLERGAIKGWILLWEPAADADAELVMGTIRDSFRPIEGVLPSDLGATASTVARRDLISGLEVRRPERSRSGFFVDAVGTVVTTAEAVQSCERVTIDEAYPARVSAVDTDLGIAILTPENPLVPLAFAQFAEADPAPGAELRVSGFSYQDTLTRPIITFGSLAEMTGLNGEAELRRLALSAQPGDTGGPVFDRNGAVMGMLLPRPETPGRMLPEDVNFAVSAAAIRALAEGNGTTLSMSRTARPVSAEMLTRMSADLTVLISCWN